MDFQRLSAKSVESLFFADNKIMKQFLLVLSLLIFYSFIYAVPKPVIMEIKFSQTQSFPALFYPFNTIEEGDKIGSEVFGFTKLVDTLKNEKFTKVTFIDPASELLKYDYSIMKCGYELWIFKNPGDGHLWGKGFLFPREKE